MANIMMTQRCNLKCEYCFANEFVNKKSTDITEENFRKAVDFIMTDPNERIGLIGGEPTVHPKLKHFLEILMEDNRVHNVVLFTNGINLDKFIIPLMNNKFHILVNCNSAKDIGQTQYDKMVKNIDKCINKYYMRDKITLGINLYDIKMDYKYIIDLLKKYNMNTLRISITVPNCNDKRTVDALEHFSKYKNFILKFFRDLDKIGVVPFYDCNPMPPCLLEEKERQEIVERLERNRVPNSNLLGDRCRCEPVIDILTNLEAVRCFGLSEYKKLNICNYRNIMELRCDFARIFDAYEFNTCSSEKCKTCHERLIMRCSGGCLAFKIADILKLHSLSEELTQPKEIENKE